MATTLVGLVGWRGMVGSVLMDRMQAEGDFAHFEPLFFSTSNAGGAAPSMAKTGRPPSVITPSISKAISRMRVARARASIRSPWR